MGYPSGTRLTSRFKIWHRDNFHALYKITKWLDNYQASYKQTSFEFKMRFGRLFPYSIKPQLTMGLLPDTQNRGLRMRRECRERFPRQRFQRKPLVGDLGMHNGTCVTLTRDSGENVPGIPGTCATRNFTYLARGPLNRVVRKYVIAFSFIELRCFVYCLVWWAFVDCNIIGYSSSCGFSSNKL